MPLLTLMISGMHKMQFVEWMGKMDGELSYLTQGVKAVVVGVVVADQGVLTWSAMSVVREVTLPVSALGVLVLEGAEAQVPDIAGAQTMGEGVRFPVIAPQDAVATALVNTFQDVAVIVLVLAMSPQNVTVHQLACTATADHHHSSESVMNLHMLTEINVC